jgi:hypothetical protein
MLLLLGLDAAVGLAGSGRAISSRSRKAGRMLLLPQQLLTSSIVRVLMRSSRTVALLLLLLLSSGTSRCSLT